MEKAKQPSIALICSQYHEKVALDALMTNRQTFVRYATVGRFREVTFVDVLFLYNSNVKYSPTFTYQYFIPEQGYIFSNSPPPRGIIVKMDSRRKIFHYRVKNTP